MSNSIDVGSSIEFTIGIGMRGPLNPQTYDLQEASITVSYPLAIELGDGRLTILPAGTSTVFVVRWTDSEGKWRNMLKSNGFESHLPIHTALEYISKLFDGVAHKLKPLGVVVLDLRGTVKAASIADGSALGRFDIARGKAFGALSFNMGTRALEKLAKDRPHFFAGAVSAFAGGIIPVPGGVLVKDKDGAILGAVGVSGDTSDNDEVAALAGVAAAGLMGDGGAA